MKRHLSPTGRLVVASTPLSREDYCVPLPPMDGPVDVPIVIGPHLSLALGYDECDKRYRARAVGSAHLWPMRDGKVVMGDLWADAAFWRLRTWKRLARPLAWSPDWRTLNGRLTLVALVAVTEPGFILRRRLRVTRLDGDVDEPFVGSDDDYQRYDITIDLCE